MTTVAGVENYSGAVVDGTGPSIRFDGINGISVDLASGILYIATGDGAHSYDPSTGKIYVNAVVKVFDPCAGQSSLIYTNGGNQAVSVLYYQGTLFASIYTANLILSIANGSVSFFVCGINNIFSGLESVLAGDTGGASGYQDGQGTNALFAFPAGICMGSDHLIYVADWGNAKIRTVTTDGLTMHLKLLTLMCCRCVKER